MKLLPTLLALAALSLTSGAQAQYNYPRQPVNSGRPANGQQHRSGSNSRGQVVVIYVTQPSAYGQGYASNGYSQQYGRAAYGNQQPANYPAQSYYPAPANYSQQAYPTSPAPAYSQPYAQPTQYAKRAGPVQQPVEELRRAEQNLLAAQRAFSSAQARVARARAAYVATTTPVPADQYPAQTEPGTDPRGN